MLSNRALVALVLSSALSGTASVQAQTPIDLQSWTPESYPRPSGFGLSSWSIAPGGGSVVQMTDSQPSVLYSDFSAVNQVLVGDISVVASSDDDLVGFVIGFRPGDTANPNADYLLVDWKRGTQSFNFGTPSCTPGSTCPRGLAVSRVLGVPTSDELWGHVNLDDVACSRPEDSVTELARGTTLGDTGWQFNQTYNFRFDFTPTRLNVFVDSVLELSIQGQFDGGRFGFYSFSQRGGTYQALTQDCVASTNSYGVGTAGTNGVPTLGASASPVLGTTIDLLIGSSAPSPVNSALLLGFQPGSFPTGLGGSLLVDPISTNSIALPPTGATFSLPVPLSMVACGLGLYAQSIQIDPGAPLGLAFSRGLELVIGN